MTATKMVVGFIIGTAIYQGVAQIAPPWGPHALGVTAVVLGAVLYDRHRGKSKVEVREEG